MIRFTGHELVRTEPGGPLRRLAALERLDVLRAANLIVGLKLGIIPNLFPKRSLTDMKLLRDSDPAMARALMAWQYRLLRRELAAPGGDGGRAA